MESQQKIFLFAGIRKAHLGAIALGTVLLFAVGCEGTNQANRPAEQENITTEDVTEISEDDPAIGELVTIRSGVAEILDDNGFVMAAAGGESILIVNPTGTVFTPPDQDMPIQVTGTLETFTAAAIEQQYGVTLDANLYGEYDQQPVIIAENFALAPRPQDFVEIPENYFDEIVAIEGDLRPLENTQNAFALFEEGWIDDVGVLVISTDQLVDVESLEDGENIVVTGQPQPIDAATLQAANLGWNDAQIQEFIARYENRPVILAEEVYPSAVPPHPSL
ncbi:hypothetical protein IQ273_11575 [Nodosilinea sp. LEGE 07298]|uniref:hypothetical protein n=1 Tax=Nodosilinea sp. LEGE 07298 TaxID=2777970 RepID=UPI00187DFDCF|nr:hypothetical protein [Nodosilinea sp. LEGE 07298]MBE9110048.1 hypothetical protein [Nodosilinea sp. LEGE 07298]